MPGPLRPTQINGSPVGYGPSLNYTFPTIGDYELELEVANGGSYCFSYVKNFCVSPVYLYSDGLMGAGSRPGEKTETAQLIKGDDPSLQTL